MCGEGRALLQGALKRIDAMVDGKMTAVDAQHATYYAPALT